MTTFKAQIQKFKRDGEPSLYGYQLYAGDDKFAEEVDFSRIADALRDLGAEVDPNQAIEISYSRIVFGAFKGSERVELHEEIADIAVERVSALRGACFSRELSI